MPNIALILRDEISRLTRKAVRSEIAPLKKASAAYRTEITALKKRIVSLEKLSVQRKRSPVQGVDSAVTPIGTGYKFSAARLKKQRARLKLTLKQTGYLLNAAQLTVSRWEDKASGVTPRAKNMPAIEAFLKLDRQAAQALLQQFGI
jgi:hypothetical protein